MPESHPVHASYFADPFVFRSGREFFAVGTGPDEAQGAVHAAAGPSVFPVLRSRDLEHWTPYGHALICPPGVPGNTFWAPEVAFDQGRWYLYYSVGHEDREHQLRVAVSDRPEGPYSDCAALTDVASVPFAIDPHPFRDDDGRWYLFHARDFPTVSEGGTERAGTALVVHELHGMTRLAEHGHTVLRAHWDWQRFARERSMYGRVLDWHTLEGPCVVKHEGDYYCLYSGGCWQNETYGVDYAVARHVVGYYDDRGAQDGPRVLRSVPGRLRGPGHCSVVLGPDDATRMLVFHAWDADMRTRSMHIAELHFGDEGPWCSAR